MLRIFLGLLALLLVILGVGAWWVASEGEEALRNAIVEEGPKVTGSRVELAELSVSPFSGKAGIGGLAIWNPSGFSETEALKLGNFSVDLAPMSLLSDPIHIREIRITAPEIRIEPTRGGTNLAALQRNIDSFSGPAEEEAAGPAVRIDHFYLTGARLVVGGGAIGFSDQAVTLGDIHLEGIGGSEGIPASEAARLAIDALMPQVESALASQLGQQLLGQARERLGALEGDVRERAGELVEENRQRIEETIGAQADKLPPDIGDKADEAVKKGLGGLLGKKKQEEPTPPPN